LDHDTQLKEKLVPYGILNVTVGLGDNGRITSA
jgi:hypothetical protein